MILLLYHEMGNAGPTHETAREVHTAPAHIERRVYDRVHWQGHKTFGFDAMTLRVLVLVLTISLPANAQTRPRARELGIPLEGTPGPLNAITDVPGVEVGHRTLISGASVRTGVTAVWPRGKEIERASCRERREI